MPYVVVVRRPQVAVGSLHEWEPGYVVSRRAVATLEEARLVVGKALLAAAIQADDPLPHLTTQSISESGGTISLPDGTVLEVERVGLNDLRTGTGTLDMTRDELIAAFNAREATR